MSQTINLLMSNFAVNLFAQLDLPRAFSLQGDLGTTLLTFAKALLILVIGLIVANMIKGALKTWLHKTDIDNQIASWITGRSQDTTLPIETWISEIVGWILTLFVVVAFLNALELEAVSQPLNALLQEVTRFLPRIGGAALLLALAWAIATVLKLIVTNALDRFKLDEKLNNQIREERLYDGEEVAPEEGEKLALGQTIGNALYWFVFLLFLPAILSVLQLEGSLRPLEELVNDILGIVPNVFAAVIIGAIGWVVAQVVKKIVTNLLVASGVNQVGERFGLVSTPTNKRQSLAQIIGSVVYVLVLIPIAITALDALQIQAISQPAINMLQQVLDILPKLFAALVIMGLAYIGGQYVSDLVTNLLTSIGFNNILEWLGIADPRTVNSTINPLVEDEGVSIPPKSTTTQTPSQIVGIIVLVAIMLVAALTAVDILQINALRQVVGVLLILAGQVLVGLLIFAVGLYFANLVFKLIVNSGATQARFLAQTARIAIIVLVSAMALERIGIAPSIVNLAFGLLTGGIAVAIALAFGLGGREAAGKALEDWLNSFKQK